MDITSERGRLCCECTELGNRSLRIEEVVIGIVEIKSQVLREREGLWLNFVTQKRSVI